MPKGKGSGFERELCRLLTAWWTGDPDRDVIFWRTSQSGGRATFRRRSGKATNQSHCGDVTALGKPGRILTRLITIELKRGYNKATANDVIDCPAGRVQQKIEEFFQQAVEAADAAKTPYWMIIHKRDMRRSVVYLPLDLFERLDALGCFVRVPGMILAAEMRQADKTVRFLQVAAISLDDFLTSVDPQDVKTVRKQLR